MNDPLIIGRRKFNSRLLTGTGKFASPDIIPDMLKACGSEIITVALRRIDAESRGSGILDFIPRDIVLLPNTSGARNAHEAVRVARIAREAGCGDFVKIEVINDMKYLMPDNWETLKATETLAKEGFIVLPYVTPDLVLAKRLEEAGASAVMPLGSPIGSARGIKTAELIDMIIGSVRIPVIIDAGLGMPSHAAMAMEMGADAVLVNTAIATAEDPVSSARAFSMAVRAGRLARLSGLAGESITASASSPLTGFLAG